MLKFLQDPSIVSKVCWIVIISYYVVSFIFIWAAKKKPSKGILKKNGVVDYFTSAVWSLAALILTISLFSLGANQLTLNYLIQYYIIFTFLFAFIYGLLEWHFPGMLEGINANSWKAEIQFLIISIQSQTTLGYTTAKPKAVTAELISCIQVLIGFFFYVVFIARAVNSLTIT